VVKKNFSTESSIPCSQKLMGSLNGFRMIDLERRFACELTRVSAHLTSQVLRPKPDGQPYTPACDSAVLLLEFTNGAHGTMQLSYTSHRAEGNMGEHRIDLYGSGGTIRIYANLDSSHLLRARENEGHFQSIPVDTRFHFVDTILGKGKVTATFEVG
jgi:predicted dehydrogenase